MARSVQSTDNLIWLVNRTRKKFDFKFNLILNESAEDHIQFDLKLDTLYEE